MLVLFEVHWFFFSGSLIWWFICFGWTFHSYLLTIVAISAMWILSHGTWARYSIKIFAENRRTFVFFTFEMFKKTTNSRIYLVEPTIFNRILNSNFLLPNLQTIYAALISNRWIFHIYILSGKIVEMAYFWIIAITLNGVYCLFLFFYAVKICNNRKTPNNRLFNV